MSVSIFFCDWEMKFFNTNLNLQPLHYNQFPNIRQFPFKAKEIKQPQKFSRMDKGSYHVAFTVMGIEATKSINVCFHWSFKRKQLFIFELISVVFPLNLDVNKMQKGECQEVNL